MKRLLLTALACLMSIYIHSQESFTFEHNGVIRNYLLTIPQTLNAQTPLVFVLHGYGGNAQQMTYSGWQEISENNNVMICYPNGTIDLFGSTHWNSNLYTGDVAFIPKGIDDHDFLVSLSNHIQTTYQLSSNCIFACGFSNGGFMSLSLACHESEHFKAVGSVGGLMSDYDYTNCNPLQSTPIIQIHGTSDGTVNYYNGVGFPFWGSEGAESIMNLWEDILGTTQTISELNINNSSVDYIRKYMASDNSEFHHYRVNGGGHVWFGSSTFMGLNSSEIIWDFFNSYCDTTNSLNTSFDLTAKKKKLIKKVDIFGREVNRTTNQILLHVYDDGSVEKKFNIE
tara:strand:- start:279 stop:1298 length:1020 start_codon:yes stop_codon:yes gene_type:complete